MSAYAPILTGRPLQLFFNVLAFNVWIPKGKNVKTHEGWHARLLNPLVLHRGKSLQQWGEVQQWLPNFCLHLSSESVIRAQTAVLEQSPSLQHRIPAYNVVQAAPGM